MKREKNLIIRKLKGDAFILTGIFTLMLMFWMPTGASAHCDSYDGPTVKDGLKALETNNPDLVLKWIDKEQEQEIIPLFEKTYSLKDGDPEVYEIVRKHFLETLVRLHRETENAPYTGLKPAGTTKKIIQMSDQALEEGDAGQLIESLNGHIANVVRGKYEKAARLEKVKNESPEQGRQYVKAYVDYTHTLEAIHDILEGGAGHGH